MAARASRVRHDSGVEIDSDGSTTMSLGSPPHRNNNPPNNQLDEGIIDAPTVPDLPPQEVKVLEIPRPQQMETCPLEAEGFALSSPPGDRATSSDVTLKNADSGPLQQGGVNTRTRATVDRFDASSSSMAAKPRRTINFYSASSLKYMHINLTNSASSLESSSARPEIALEDVFEQAGGKFPKHMSRNRLARERVNQNFLPKPRRSNEDRALLLAAADNDVARCETLLKQGARANARDESRRTALHFAATIRTGAPLVNLLVQHGANPNAQDAADNTPLHLAICINNEQVIQELLKSGSDLKAVDRSGRNPMQLATSRLRLIQLETSSEQGGLSEKIRIETLKMIKCLQSYLRQQDNTAASVASASKVFSSFQEKFFASKSSKQFSSDVSDLLSSLEQLQLL